MISVPFYIYLSYLFIQLVKYSYNDITIINEQGQQGSDQHLQLSIHTHAHTHTHTNMYTNMQTVNT